MRQAKKLTCIACIKCLIGLYAFLIPTAFPNETLTTLSKKVLSLSLDHKSNCETTLESINNEYKKITFNRESIPYIAKQGNKLLAESLNARSALRRSTPRMAPRCIALARELNTTIRNIEDLIGLYYFQPTQMTEAELNLTFTHNLPWESPPLFPSNSKKGFKLRDGDIILMKAIDFGSSMVARELSPLSSYAHAALVATDPITNSLKIIEAQFGQGSIINEPLNSLHVKNTKYLVLRPKDMLLGKKASSFIYDKILNLKKSNQVIPFDYYYDYQEEKSFYCSELIYYAYKNVGAVDFSKMRSILPKHDEELLNAIQIKKNSNFIMPGDFEFDQNFDIVLDWSDLKLVRESLRKDAIVEEIFKWAQTYHYKLHQTPQSTLLRLLWVLKKSPFISKIITPLLLSSMSDFSDHIPAEAVSGYFNFENLVNIMSTYLTIEDENYHKRNAYWMEFEDLKKCLEDYRLSHSKELRGVFSNANQASAITRALDYIYY